MAFWLSAADKIVLMGSTVLQK